MPDKSIYDLINEGFSNKVDDFISRHGKGGAMKRVAIGVGAGVAGLAAVRGVLGLGAPKPMPMENQRRSHMGQQQKYGIIRGNRHDRHVNNSRAGVT